MKKKVAILGSTGSIGKLLLNIINKNKKNFEIVLLTANNNYKKLYKQSQEFNVKNVIISDKNSFEKFKKLNKKKNLNVHNNFRNLEKITKTKIDYTMSAIVGLDGLEPTINIIKYTKIIAIANKESIICGWNLIRKLASKNNTTIIPVDSEHYSIFKLIENLNQNEIEKIYLTASGGPFLNYKKKELLKISPKEALKHPKWKMGQKITIDSSTLMNKILELIEAQKLFNLPSNKLDIIIHPNSLVHAIVKKRNGLITFIYHDTSMIIPLANGIFDGKLNIKEFYNNDRKNDKLENLIFKKVDKKIFPVISLKKRVNEYPSTSIIVNAANEILVELFLNKKIPFLSISKTILKILNDRNYKKYAIRKPKNIHEITNIDKWARENIKKILNLND